MLLYGIVFVSVENEMNIALVILKCVFAYGIKLYSKMNDLLFDIIKLNDFISRYIENLIDFIKLDSVCRLWECFNVFSE